jgi:fumarate reductase subunit D
LFFVGISLAIGVAGYMYFARFTFVDAFLNASMILGGMGPIGELPNDASKVFASIYALFSGIALLGTVALILTPLLHRLLHALHLDDDDHT